jgi:hypothetical protein
MPYCGQVMAALGNNMKLFDLLNCYAPISPASCKIHLACYNGTEEPLDVYFSGDFKPWQESQNQKNFERSNILGLIQLPSKNSWLYVGIFSSSGCLPREGGQGFIYQTAELLEYSEFAGRLIVNFERPGRQSYLLAENWTDQILVSELSRTKHTIPDFPGYKVLSVSMSQLSVIVGESIISWKSALASVSGVYLITDSHTGKLYVGSAYGDGGFWGRWSEYVPSGHGGNVRLRNIISSNGADYHKNFRFSILEVCDSSASKGDVIARESHWKRVLCTQIFGYNEN